MLTSSHCDIYGRDMEDSGETSSSFENLDSVLPFWQLRAKFTKDVRIFTATYISNTLYL